MLFRLGRLGHLGHEMVIWMLVAGYWMQVGATNEGARMLRFVEVC